MNIYCCSCGKDLTKKKQRIDYHELCGNSIDYECIKCYKGDSKRNNVNYRKYDSCETTPSNSGNISSSKWSKTSSSENIGLEIGIKRSINDHKTCVFGCTDKRKMKRLSEKECLEIFINKNIFVPYGNKICVIRGEKKILDIPTYFKPKELSTLMRADEIKSIILTFQEIIITKSELIRLAEGKVLSERNTRLRN